jgi:hypothetical protein
MKIFKLTSCLGQIRIAGESLLPKPQPMVYNVLKEIALL